MSVKYAVPFHNGFSHAFQGFHVIVIVPAFTIRFHVRSLEENIHLPFDDTAGNGQACHFPNRLVYVNIRRLWVLICVISSDIRRTGHGHIPIVHIYAPVTAPGDAAAVHCEGPHIIMYADSFSGDRAAVHYEGRTRPDKDTAVAVSGKRAALQLQRCTILQEYGSPNRVNTPPRVRSLSAGDDTAGRQTRIGSMRILGTAVRDGQGHRVRAFLHPEHTAITGHLEHMAVQVEGQRSLNIQSLGDLDILCQLDSSAVGYGKFQLFYGTFFRRRRVGGAHQGICYIPRCNKSCPYGQRAYQYQGHQNGEQSSLHGGSSFYGSHISLPGLCAAKFLVGKVFWRAGSVVRPSYQKVSRKATGISRCWHKKSVWEV